MKPRRKPRRGLSLKTVVLVAAATYGLGWLLSGPAVMRFPGMVRQTQIRIAPEVTGRLASIAVRPGQHVHKGDVLALVDNPDLAAAAGEARAAAASAKAERNRIFSGVRAEEVAIAAENVRTAQANLLLARQQNDRAVALAAKDFGSRQQLDETTASLIQAQADLELKRAQYAAATAGPTAEERALSEAQVASAQATVAEQQSKLDKTKLIAPLDGVVGTIVAEPGEILSPGKPVMLVLVEGDFWFALTLREDFMQGVTMGATIPLSTDDGRHIDARVTDMRPLGEFATWRAARAVGDHDLDSFQLRLDPRRPAASLEPGMRVWLTPR